MPRLLQHRLDPASRLVRLMCAEYGVPLDLEDIRPWRWNVLRHFYIGRNTLDETNTLPSFGMLNLHKTRRFKQMYQMIQQLLVHSSTSTKRLDRDASRFERLAY